MEPTLDAEPGWTGARPPKTFFQDLPWPGAYEGTHAQPNMPAEVPLPFQLSRMMRARTHTS